MKVSNVKESDFIEPPYGKVPSSGNLSVLRARSCPDFGEARANWTPDDIC